MDKDAGNFEEILKADAEARQAQDFDDLQNEIGGRETGRQPRFLPDDHENNPRSRKRRDGLQAMQMTALEAMLANDPIYRALYDGAMDRLRTAESATEQALDQAEQALDTAQHGMDDILSRANRLADGSRVFRDENGDVRHEDGTLVTGPELDEIVWQDGAPGYEAYLAQQRALQEAQALIDTLTNYQINVLGKFRDRLTDPDNPLTEDELKAMQQAIAAQMPDAARSELSPDKNDESWNETPTFDISSPQL